MMKDFTEITNVISQNGLCRIFIYLFIFFKPFTSVSNYFVRKSESLILIIVTRVIKYKIKAIAV